MSKNSRVSFRTQKGQLPTEGGAVQKCDPGQRQEFIYISGNLEREKAQFKLEHSKAIAHFPIEFAIGIIIRKKKQGPWGPGYAGDKSLDS